MKDRFARQHLIDGWDQRGLCDATAVVVGVGALGNEVAKNLALAGVGRLVLCDPDVVSVSNLSRTVLFGPADVGQPKVAAAAGRLGELAPGVAIETRPSDHVSGVGLGELADAGVVLGCLDTRYARLRLLGRCALVDAALVDGGTGPWGGEVRVRQAAGEPCYACSLSPYQRGESDLPRSCAEAQAPAEQPASIAATALVAAWMTVAALQVLFGQPVRYRMLRVDGETGHAGPVALTRDADCPFHRPLPDTAELVPCGTDATVGSLLELLADDADPIGWISFPVPAAGSRSEFVPGYAAGQSNSERLRDADPSWRLSSIGVAPHEILTVRSGEGEYRWIRIGR